MPKAQLFCRSRSAYEETGQHAIPAEVSSHVEFSSHVEVSSRVDKSCVHRATVYGCGQFNVGFDLPMGDEQSYEYAVGFL